LRLATPGKIPKFASTMMKLCIFAGTTIFGILGGLLATLFGMDTFSLGSFFLSGIGSVVGVWVGWKVALKLK
jgi:hypothetical protein